MVEYYLIPPSGNADLLILLVVMLPPAIILFGLLTQVKQKGQRNSAKISVVAMLLIFVFILHEVYLAPRQTHVAVGEGMLRLKPASSAAFEITREMIIAAYIADWREAEELAPLKRTAGTKVENYRAGYFRLQNESPAVLIAGGTRVLVVELADRYVLLAPDDFELFVGDFNERVAPVMPEPPAEIRPVTGKPMPLQMPRLFRLIMGFIGVMTFLMGYLIRFNKKLFEALYPFDIYRLDNIEKHARYVGNFYMIIGIMFIILQFLPPVYYLLIIVVAITGTIYGLSKNIIFFPI